MSSNREIPDYDVIWESYWSSLFDFVRRLIDGWGNKPYGFAILDANAKLYPAQLPQATTTTLGAVKLATTAEAVAGTDTQKAITAAGLKAAIDAGGGGGGAKAKAFTVTLSTTWTNNQQTVSNANFLTGAYAYTVSPSPSNYTAYVTSGIYALDVTTAGQMVFKCSEPPTTALNVNIERFETE